MTDLSALAMKVEPVDEDMTDLSCCSDDSLGDYYEESSYSSTDDEDDDEDEVSFCQEETDDEKDDEDISHNNDNNNNNTQLSPTPPSPTFVATLLSHLMHSLYANQDDFTHLNLTFPIMIAPCQQGQYALFGHLLHAIRSNTTVTKCSICNVFFQTLSNEQKRALVDAVCSIPSLRSLELDAVFPDFVYTFNCCRSWNQDCHYRHCGQFYHFDNQTIKELRITQIPSNVSEQYLGHLVLMTLSNFSSIQKLDMNFVGPASPSQEVLLRLALNALCRSKCVSDVTFRSDVAQEAGMLLSSEEGDTSNDDFFIEICVSRKDQTLRVLKVRCNEDHLTCQSYMILAQMIQVHRETLKGLVLDTTVDNNCALTIANTLGRNSSSLKALCLGTFDCQDKTRRDGLVSLITQVLRPQQQEQHQASPAVSTEDITATTTSTSSLEYLSLVCQELDDQGVRQIAKALSQSNLRELILFLDNQIDSAISSQGVAALAKVLKVNKTIENFTLICNAVDDDGILALTNVLTEDNRTLKNLHLKCSKAVRVSARGYQALVDMLQSNDVLETIELSRCQSEAEEADDGIDGDADEDGMSCIEEQEEGCFKAKIDFLLRLNQARVRKLHLNVDTTPSQFLEKLVFQRDDLNTLFHMLSTNPSFVAFGTQVISSSSLE